MADETDDRDDDNEIDDDMPDSIIELSELAQSIAIEAQEMVAAEQEIRASFGGSSTPERVAILKILDLLNQTVMPIVATLAADTANVAADLFDEIDVGSESMLLKADAELISTALLGAAQIMAAYEAETSSEDGKQQCQVVGESITKALTRIREITIEEEEDQDKDLN